uniref:CDP-diacylglycerol--glycerol-3-phosphate 3-phosphatidyltransferase n=2 Tax=Lygus hesperus TaxID=30085 RepID=A0A146LH60_LYGHE
MIRGAIQVLEKTIEGSLQLPGCFSWLQSSAPMFPLKGEQVRIIQHPEDFYRTLINGCQTAQNRIMLASLYLGNGSLEKDLVETIRNRMCERDKLEVTILLDANRGSRGAVNSRTVLMPLLQKSRLCQVSLFHTPSLRGPLKILLPARYNELVGLQHMKLYLFDDSVIISGANLSEDYFTNRQDRYIMIKNCKQLADFYWNLVQNISSVSLALDSSDRLSPRSFHPYKSNQQQYISDARQKIWGFYKSAMDNPIVSQPGDDTWVFPLLELPPLEVHQDSTVTQKLLESCEEGSHITLSTGYFNLTDQYADTILEASKADYKILMAHPTANGFLKARGLAGGIPGAYTGLALSFLKRVAARKQSDRISMFEYIRPGWTYHAKGLWYYPPHDDTPVLTLVGSSNYGSRSVRRDLETQMAIVTQNEDLRRRLGDEENSFTSLAHPFTRQIGLSKDRKPKLWIVTTMKLFKTFF